MLPTQLSQKNGQWRKKKKTSYLQDVVKRQSWNEVDEEPRP